MMIHCQRSRGRTIQPRITNNNSQRIISAMLLCQRERIEPKGTEGRGRIKTCHDILRDFVATKDVTTSCETLLLQNATKSATLRRALAVSENLVERHKVSWPPSPQIMTEFIENAKGAGAKRGGRQNRTRRPPPFQNGFRPPLTSVRFAPPPPYPVSLCKSARNSQSFPQPTSSETAFFRKGRTWAIAIETVLCEPKFRTEFPF